MLYCYTIQLKSQTATNIRHIQQHEQDVFHSRLLSRWTILEDGHRLLNHLNICFLIKIILSPRLNTSKPLVPLCLVKSLVLKPSKVLSRSFRSCIAESLVLLTMFAHSLSPSPTSPTIQRSTFGFNRLWLLATHQWH